MTAPVVRILFFADTHLGFDLPARPRIERRRRGFDFLANFERVLDAAVSEKVDCIVHGGDLFFRSRIPASLVQSAFLPMKNVADAGIPIFIVPGNHERSRIPYDLLALHPRIHIFDRPRTYTDGINGVAVALTGFPYIRNGVRSEFRQLLSRSQWRGHGADLNLLCVHHCFEGATVGTHNYTFRNGHDVVRVDDIPEQFTAVLTGHVHRHQILTSDLKGRVLKTPILYPGSIERTSFAEKDEAKGYLLLDISCGDSHDRPVVSWQFVPLPTRPMVVEELTVENVAHGPLASMIHRLLLELPEDAVVQIRARGTPMDESREVLGAPFLRTIAPASMNVQVVLVDERKGRRQ